MTNQSTLATSTANHISTNVATARRWFEEGWSGNLSLVYDTFISNPIVDGKEYTLEFVTGTYQSTLDAFPDLRVSVDQALEDDDWVVIRYAMAGTHQKDWRGIAATNVAINAPGISMLRFENGKVVELWDRFDLFSLLLQLNAIPMPFKMG